jgi:ubiquinone/menaquinone biosynthesis C-methylase UbiE
MKITDYSKIAENYDKNSIRHDIPKDETIERLFQRNNKNFTVLDLSCGTGNYLMKQIVEYPLSKYNITWIGIDLSEHMIKKAMEKNINADIIIGDVLNMPLENDSVNYIQNRFAFHHYTDKEKAVKEMYRVLKNGGVLNLVNLNHEYMKYSWVYKYFPASRELDTERFLKTIDLYKIFEKNGFRIKLEIKTEIKKFGYKGIIEETRNKDMSQLQIITDEEYNKGLNKMEEDSKTNEYIIGDVATTEMYCEKE